MSAVPANPPLRRDNERGLIGGVLAGLSAWSGMDLAILRILFVIAAVISGGLALLAYVVAWAAIPADADGPAPLLRRVRISSAGGGWRVATGVGLLVLSALLAFRELGIWWSDALVWPLVLAAFGAALLWQRSRGGSSRLRGEGPESRAWAAAGPAAGGAEAAGSLDVAGSADVTGSAEVGAGGRSRVSSELTDLYRGVFGILLVVGAALLFLSSNNILGGIRDAALTGVVVVVAIALILAPFLWRLGRNLAEERAERIRSQERAEVGAHLHDSVLQTLVLVQKRTDDPREVASLARRQERELRQWLAGGDERSSDESLAAALRAAAEGIEDERRTSIEVVVVGDCGLDERAEAILGAAREAMLNAAEHAPEPGPIRVFAEVDEGRIEAFVRDRGPGFDLTAVPEDRRGVRESILGRMERAGGRAEVGAAPDGGTEVALSIERDGAEGGRGDEAEREGMGRGRR